AEPEAADLTADEAAAELAVVQTPKEPRGVARLVVRSPEFAAVVQQRHVRHVAGSAIDIVRGTDRSAIPVGVCVPGQEVVLDRRGRTWPTFIDEPREPRLWIPMDHAYGVLRTDAVEPEQVRVRALEVHHLHVV